MEKTTRPNTLPKSPLAVTTSQAAALLGVSREFLATPATGGGVKRPAALALFRRGDVASTGAPCGLMVACRAGPAPSLSKRAGVW